MGHRTGASALLLLCGLFASSLGAVAQEAQREANRSDPPPYYWITAGIGGADYFGGLAEFTFAPQPSESFALRALYLEEFRICLWGCSTPVQYHADIGLLYGRMTKGKWGYASAAGGLALTLLRMNEESSSGGFQIYHTTVGLPLELQAFLTPLPFAGIGVVASADINPKQSFAGIFLSLQIGSLR
jgi:hypothetical protein